jgi:hypothetical protein
MDANRSTKKGRRQLFDVMLRFEPSDEPRPVWRLDFAKTDEGGHLVTIAPHRALHVLKPAHQRIAGDLQEARRLPKPKKGGVKKIVAGRLLVAADQISQVKKTVRHAQRRDWRRGLGRPLLREKVVLSLRGFCHKTDCVAPQAPRRRSARRLAKPLKIDLALQANDLHGRPAPLTRKDRAGAGRAARACPQAKRNQ